MNPIHFPAQSPEGNGGVHGIVLPGICSSPSPRQEASLKGYNLLNVDPEFVHAEFVESRTASTYPQNISFDKQENDLWENNHWGHSDNLCVPILWLNSVAWFPHALVSRCYCGSFIPRWRDSDATNEVHACMGVGPP